MWTYISIAVLLSILLVIQYLIAIHKAANKIWSGSGIPFSMSEMLLASLQSYGQILFGILAITLLTILIDGGKISSEAGLPLISALAAYVLSKAFRENRTSKNSKDEG